MGAILESTDKSYSINGNVFPLNSCSVVKNSKGIRISFLAYSQRMDIGWNGSTIDGVNSTSPDDLYSWFKEKCFSLDGGGGITLPIEISDVTGLPGDLDDKSNKADEIKSSITFTLDGVQTVFDIPHDLGVIPSSMQVTFEDAANLNFVQSIRTRDATKVTFTCNDAPAPGSETVYYTISR